MQTDFEHLRVYKLAEKISDAIWQIASDWNAFAKDTIGRQVVRSADSMGANIAEGAGRGSYADNRRFVRIARGSLNETRHWLRRAFKRGLLTDVDVQKLRPLLDELGPKLNNYLKSIGRSPHTPNSAPARTANADAGQQRTTDNGQRTTNT